MEGMLAHLRRTPVLSWSVEQVGKWLKFLGLAKYDEQFASHRINGSSLMNLTDDVLDEMHIEDADREHILMAVSNLDANQSRALRQSQRRVTIKKADDVTEITATAPLPASKATVSNATSKPAGETRPPLRVPFYIQDIAPAMLYKTMLVTEKVSASDLGTRCTVFLFLFRA